MKKILVVAAVGLSLFGLSGCADLETQRQSQLEYEREMVQIGKECDEAGGNWEYDSFLGNWSCSFTRNK